MTCLIIFTDIRAPYGLHLYMNYLSKTFLAESKKIKFFKNIHHHN